MPSCFAPLIDEDTKILVIGTMPSEASLAAREYYAFKHNAFWKIIADVSGRQLASYSDKTAVVKSLKIGLWDNLQFCSRQGSLDSNIKDEVPNDFETLLANYSNIKKLIFNGQKSFAYFKKYHKQLLQKYNYVVMPSTSPANAGTPYHDKLKIWRQALEL